MNRGLGVEGKMSVRETGRHARAQKNFSAALDFASSNHDSKKQETEGRKAKVPGGNGGHATGGR